MDRCTLANGVLEAATLLFIHTMNVDVLKTRPIGTERGVLETLVSRWCQGMGCWCGIRSSRRRCRIQVRRLRGRCRRRRRCPARSIAWWCRGCEAWGRMGVLHENSQPETRHAHPGRRTRLGRGHGRKRRRNGRRTRIRHRHRVERTAHPKRYPDPTD